MTELEKKMLAALKSLVRYGCPECSGDCSSANPPVYSCPIANAEALIAEAEAASQEQAPQPSADGWIPWAGGECPLSDGISHQVKFVGGTVSVISKWASYWDWSRGRNGNHYDIIAYRIVGEPK